MAEPWKDHTTLTDSDLFLESDMDSLSHDEDFLSNSGTESHTFPFQVNNNNQIHPNQPQQDENFKEQAGQQECVQSQITSSQTPHQQQVITGLENFALPQSPQQHEKVGSVTGTCKRGSIALNFVHPDVSSNLSETSATTSSLPGHPGVSYPQSQTLRPGGSRAFNFVGDKSVADVQGIPHCDDRLVCDFLSGYGNANLHLPNTSELEMLAANAAAALQQLTFPGLGEVPEQSLGNGLTSLDTAHNMSRAILSTDMVTNHPQMAMHTDLPQNASTYVRPQIAVDNILTDTFTSNEMVQNITTNQQPQISTSRPNDAKPQASALCDLPQASLSGTPEISAKAVPHDTSTKQSKNSRNSGLKNKRPKDMEEKTDAKVTTKKIKLYEQPPSDDPKEEKRRKDAIRAKRNRDETREELVTVKGKLTKVEAENQHLRTQNLSLLQLLRHHNITIPQYILGPEMHNNNNNNNTS